jgi:hypothetical protein
VDPRGLPRGFGGFTSWIRGVYLVDSRCLPLGFEGFTSWIGRVYLVDSRGLPHGFEGFSRDFLSFGSTPKDISVFFWFPACNFKLKPYNFLSLLLVAVTTSLGVQGGVLPLGQSAVLAALPPLPPAHRAPHGPQPGRHGRRRTGTGPHLTRLPRPGLAQGF